MPSIAGIHMITDAHAACKIPRKYLFINYDLMTMRVENGAFVLLVGVASSFIGTIFALQTPYLCCRMFGKCEHRGWRIVSCIRQSDSRLSAVFGVFAIVVSTVVYSIRIGVSFYPLTRKEFEIADCLRMHYYSTLTFLLITHVVSLVVTVLGLITFLIISVDELNKCCKLPLC